ncbi:MAG: CRISPR-associated endoribonuclease Cas6 [Candidatus Aenigmatarchaeota archaeon]
MRIILKLKSLTNSSYFELSNYHIQGFIYKLLRNTEFSSLHHFRGFKMFNFSNIFPIEKSGIIEQDKKYNLIISSPNKAFIDTIYKKLKEYKNKEIKFGELRFLLENFKYLKLKLKFPWKTSTPIVLTKHKDVYLSDKKEVYKVSVKTLNHPALKLFKKKTMNIDLKNKDIKEISINKLPYLDNKKFKIVKIVDVYYNFQKQSEIDSWLRDLKNNSLEKYFSFTGYNFYFEEPIFEEFSFYRPVSSKIKMKGKEVIVIGSLWNKLGVLRKLDREEKKFYSFLLDCGLGKLNSLGFGFVNPTND